jgi:O-antigen/teichoic acid export membrane protein
MNGHDVPASSRGPLRRASIRGATYLIGSSLGTKLCTVGTQIVLGWLLSEKDFAVYGIAISLTVITSALTDGGVQKYLRQQPDRYDELVGPTTVLATILAVFAALVVAALGLASGEIYQDERIRPVALCLAAGLLLTPPAVIARSRFAVDLRFRDQALIDTGGSVARSLLMVGFAWIGLGPLALALPIPIVNLMQGIAMCAWGGLRGFNLRGVDYQSLRSVLLHTRWIMLAAACGTIVARGDYLVLGLFASGIVGTYFFGFQISASTMQVATMSAASVLLPTLSRLAADPKRLSGGVEQAMRMAALLIAPSSALLFLVMPFVIHTLWQGRWDDAIPVAEAVAISTAIAGLGLIAGTGIEASGGWRTKSLLSLADGLSLIAVLVVVAERFSESLVAISLAVVLQRSLFGLLNVAMCGRRLGVGIGAALGWIRGPTLVAAVGCVLAVAIGSSLGGSESPLVALTRATIFTAVFVAILHRRLRSAIADLRQLRSSN